MKCTRLIWCRTRNRNENISCSHTIVNFLYLAQKVHGDNCRRKLNLPSICYKLHLLKKVFRMRKLMFFETTNIASGHTNFLFRSNKLMSLSPTFQTCCGISMNSQELKGSRALRLNSRTLHIARSRFSAIVLSFRVTAVHHGLLSLSKKLTNANNWWKMNEANLHPYLLFRSVNDL